MIRSLRESGNSAVAALAIGAVSFLVVIAVVAVLWLFCCSAPTSRANAGSASTAEGYDIVTLLDNVHFVTPLPPAGDRSITYQYTVDVKVAKGRRQVLDNLVSPDGRNMLPAIKENVRKIIAAEDYLKLRSEQLDDVKRNIRRYLNGLMAGNIVEDVIFDKWNVIS